MSIDGFRPGSYRARQTSDQFVSSRAQLDNLQRQLATGKASESYGGLGIDRRISLDIHAKVSVIDGWQSGIERGNLRITMMAQSVERFSKMTQEAKGDIRPGSYVQTASGQTIGQMLSAEKLQQSVDLLNIDIEGRYMFSGRTTDTKPVVSYDLMMNGDGAGRAGIKQMISERKLADTGVSGLGRLIVAGAGTNVTLDEEATNPAYGFKISGGVSSTPAITTAFTAGPPANLTTSVVGTPAQGDTVRIKLNLFDGTTTEITLEARNASSPGPAETSFTIGATPAATAANLQASLTAAMTREAQTSLSASSSIIAATNFFNGTPTTPPLRVPGPGFATAVAAPTAGTALNTVIWYQGDHAATPPRTTAPLQIDASQMVGTGARANEQAFRIGMAQFAALAAETFSATDVNARDRYEALAQRGRSNLSYQNGVQAPSEIAVELATAQTAMKNAKERHSATKIYLTAANSKIEDASVEEVASSILTLQTRLQASYQTTSILSRLSLTEYLR
ncbi:MAG: hypothetical protein ACRDBH_11105 [Bosea sp. (in: a-proteobacteria)]